MPVHVPVMLLPSDITDLIRFTRAAIDRAKRDLAKNQNPVVREQFEVEIARYEGMLQRLTAAKR